MSRYVRAVGVAYLLITFIGIMNTFLIKQGVYSVETFADTASQYRLAQAVDLIMYAIVIWASWALYVVTKPINHNMALLALLFRFGEGLLGCVAAMVSLMVLVVLGTENSWPAFTDDQLQALGQMFMSLSNSVWDILFVLMGIGAAIYIGLFLKAKYVPGWLCAWGLFTYVVMALFGFARILFPDLPEELMLVMFPGALFELTFGLWLVIKGVDARRLKEA